MVLDIIEIYHKVIEISVTARPNQENIFYIPFPTFNVGTVDICDIKGIFLFHVIHVNIC